MVFGNSKIVFVNSDSEKFESSIASSTHVVGEPGSPGARSLLFRLSDSSLAIDIFLNIRKCFVEKKNMQVLDKGR